MSNPKATHYWTQLRLALSSGCWSSHYPAKAPNGAELTWSDLLRKFNKHCRGYVDVAELANQTQALGVLLSGPNGNDDDNDFLDDVSEDRPTQWREKLYPLNLGRECILPEERTGDAKTGYDVVKALNSANSDSLNFLLAFYAYVLGSPEDCLSYLARVPDIVQIQNHIPSAPNSTRSTTSNTLQVPSGTASAAPSLSSLTSAGSIVSELGVAESLKDGRAWAMTEAFRSVCLQGMSHERLSEDITPALKAYAAALPLFRIFLADITANPALSTLSLANTAFSTISSTLSHPASFYSVGGGANATATALNDINALTGSLTRAAAAASIGSGGKVDYSTFKKFRELWRWVERIIRRAVILLAKSWDLLTEHLILASQSTSNGETKAVSSLWTWLDHYTTFSAFWPPTFRANHRSTVCVIYLRALTLKFGTAPPSLLPLAPDPTSFPAGSAAAVPSTSGTQRSDSLLLSTGGVQGAHPASQSQVRLSATLLLQPHPHTARLIIQEYRAILEATTKFPKAGERNWKVEEFVDLCVALWEVIGAGGSRVVSGKGKGKAGESGLVESLSTGIIVDILWWATRLTFNSYRVLRHMTRVLYVSGDVGLAKRTLKLYVQVVSKAWETRDAEGLAAKGDPAGSDSLAPRSSTNGYVDSVPTDQEKEALLDELWRAMEGEPASDEDEEGPIQWVEALLFGSRMLCKSASMVGLSTAPFPLSTSFPSGTGTAAANGGLGVGAGVGIGVGGGGGSGCEARQDVREAGKLVERARKKLVDIKRLKGGMYVPDEEIQSLEASLELAEGIYWSVLAFVDADSHRREAQLLSAHEHLFRAVSIYPTPEAYYHLALSFARPHMVASGLAETSSTSTSNGPYSSPHNLDAAIEAAGRAVEGDPGEVRYWHLLGLLLAKLERYKDAEEILERGLVVGEFGDAQQGAYEGPEDEEDDADEDEPQSSVDVPDEDEGEENEPRSQQPVPAATGSSRQSQWEDDVGSEISTARENTIRPSTTRPSQNHNRAKRLSTTIDAPSSTTPGTPTQSDCVEVWPWPLYALHPKAKLVPSASKLLRQTITGQQYPSALVSKRHPHHTEYHQSISKYKPPTTRPEPSRQEAFEHALQLRMTQVALMEVVEGAEGAADRFLNIFSWIADKRGVGSVAGSSTIAGSASVAGVGASSVMGGPAQTGGASSHHGDTQRLSVDANGRPIGTRVSDGSLVIVGTDQNVVTSADGNILTTTTTIQTTVVSAANGPGTGESEGGGSGSGRGREKLALPPPIKISPAPHDVNSIPEEYAEEKEDEKETSKKAGKKLGKRERGNSMDRDRDRGGDRDAAKKKMQQMQQMVKHRMHQGQVRITTISRKIGHGVVRGGSLKRATSTPDFHAVLRQTAYQASSIHSRRRLSFVNLQEQSTPTDSPPPPPPPPPPSVPPLEQIIRRNSRTARENRLLSDLWLMSAATFRRLGKIEQAKGAIQEAEVRDESNPGVWVQLGLYYVALGHRQHAIDALQKALFICPDDISANVHLAKLYLTIEESESGRSSGSAVPMSPTATQSSSSSSAPHNEDNNLPWGGQKQDDIDLAAAMLSQLTRGVGWDVAEAWFFLAKAYGFQGRRDKERGSLKRALELSKRRGVRDVNLALGWCL